MATITAHVVAAVAPARRPSIRATGRWLACLVLACGCVFPACRQSNTSPAGPTGPSDPGPQSASFSFLNGTWVGLWTDTRYNVSGTLRATFTVVGSTVTATGTIGLASLGLGDEDGTGTGTVSGQTLNFTFSSSTVGTGSGALSAGGAGSGSGSVTGTLNFGAFTYTGTAAGSTISGTFNFTSPTGGNGLVALTRQ